MPHRGRKKRSVQRRATTSQIREPTLDNASSSSHKSATKVITELSHLLQPLEERLKSNKEAVLSKYDKSSTQVLYAHIFGSSRPQKDLQVSKVLQGGCVIFQNDDATPSKQTHTEATSSPQEDTTAIATAGTSRTNIVPVSATICREDTCVISKCQKAFDTFEQRTHSSTSDDTLPQNLQNLLIPSSPQCGGPRNLCSNCAPHRPKSLGESLAQIIPKEPGQSGTQADADSACFTYEMQAIPESLKVAVVSGQGQSFTGVLPLPGTDCMLLDETCMHTIISDSKVAGEMLVCRGRGCITSFQNVHFEACPVIMLDGAVVTFDQCSFCGADSTSQGARTCFTYALFAQGEGTMVSVANCSFTQSEHLKDACVVQQGARVCMEQCIFRNVSRTSLRVSGANSAVTCCRSRFTRESTGSCQSTSDSDDGVSTGVCVYDGALVRLWGCVIQKLLQGIYVSTATAHVLHSVIDESEFEGLVAFSNSHVVVTKCVLQGCKNRGRGVGAYADGGSTLDVSGCVFFKNRSTGLMAMQSAAVAVSDCEMAENMGSGIFATGDEVDFTVQDTVCIASLNAVYFQGCRECRLVHVQSVLNFQAFKIESVQGCTLLNCTAAGYREYAVAVSGTCGIIEIVGCTFGQCGEFGGLAHSLTVQGGALVCVERCTLRPGPAQLGAHVRGAEAELDLRNCEISADVGVVCQGAALTMIECTTSLCASAAVQLCQNAEGYLTRHKSRSDGMVVKCDDSSLHANACEFSDFITAVIFTGSSAATSSMKECKLVARPNDVRVSKGVVVQAGKMTLNMIKCIIRCTFGSSLVVEQMDGVVNVQDCHLSESKKGCGIEVLCPSAKVLVKRCTIRDNHALGINCRKGGHVVAQRVHTSTNGIIGYGLFDGGSMKLTDCSSFKDGYGVKADRAVVSGDAPKVTLRRVLVRQSVTAGVVVCGAVNCSIVNCCAMQCTGGFLILGNETGPLTSWISIKDSRAQGCIQQGVSCRNAGQVTLRNVLAIRNKSAGFASLYAGSTMHLFECQSKGNLTDCVSSDDAVLLPGELNHVVVPRDS